MSTFSILLILVVVLAGVSLFVACNPFRGPVNKTLSDSYYYNRLKNAIHYSPMGNWFALGNTKMAANVETFEVLDRDFGKDKDKIYYKDKDITHEADYATFRALDGKGYDKDHVYVTLNPIEHRLKKGFKQEKSPIQFLDVKRSFCC